MTIREQLLSKIEQLSPDQQREAMDYVESLQKKRTHKVPLHNPLGLWAGLSPDITEEELSAARKEMWGRFPTEDI